MHGKCYARDIRDVGEKWRISRREFFSHPLKPFFRQKFFAEKLFCTWIYGQRRILHISIACNQILEGSLVYVAGQFPCVVDLHMQMDSDSLFLFSILSFRGRKTLFLSLFPFVLNSLTIAASFQRVRYSNSLLGLLLFLSIQNGAHFFKERNE